MWSRVTSPSSAMSTSMFATSSLKKGRRKQTGMKSGELPATLEAALLALYRDYAKTFEIWNSRRADTPPVFIVVANNTATSKLVYDWISGWCENPEDEDADKRRWKTGNLELFRNIEDGQPLNRPRTILIDSEQLYSGEAMSEDFKAIARPEIEAFKREIRQRDRSRDVDKVDDAELLREVMNTVGRKGRLGEQVRCVVSVSMLTEGWDANTVTHVLGCRAFGTQLLCEQVVGRALRRVSYEPDENGLFRPEYADVLGVPFTFMPAKSAKDFSPPRPRTHIFADTDRPAPEICFPRVDGYRVLFPKGRLNATFTHDSHFRLGADVPIPKETEVDPLVGMSNIIDLSELDLIRGQTIAYMLAKRALEKWTRMVENQEGEPRFLFPQFLSVARRWISECLDLRDGRTVGYLSLAGYREEAVRRVVVACAKTRRLGLMREGAAGFLDLVTHHDLGPAAPPQRAAPRAAPHLGASEIRSRLADAAGRHRQTLREPAAGNHSRRVISSRERAAICSSICSLEDVAAVKKGPPYYQLYVFRDRELTKDMVARAKAAGIKTLVITARRAVRNWCDRGRRIRLRACGSPRTPRGEYRRGRN
jgi:hypothetical protein